MIVSQTIVRFNAIYVMESLASGEAKTGQDLFDTVVYPETRKLDRLHAEFCSVNDRTEFEAKLRQIAIAARRANHLPVLHLEAHGFDEGIQLADGSTIRWREITPFLADINEACRMNLIFVAVSCQGWNLTHSLMPSDRAPVLMVVGPVNDMTAADLLSATRIFYQTLVAELDLNAALEAMNDNRPYEEWSVKPGLAEILFCRVFRAYMKEQTPEVRQSRENAIVARLAKARNLDVKQTAVVRASLRADLQDFRADYDRQRHTFLMLDLFPQNAEKFGLTFEKCLPPDTGADDGEGP